MPDKYDVALLSLIVALSAYIATIRLLIIERLGRLNLPSNKKKSYQWYLGLLILPDALLIAAGIALFLSIFSKDIFSAPAGDPNYGTHLVIALALFVAILYLAGLHIASWGKTFENLFNNAGASTPSGRSNSSVLPIAISVLSLVMALASFVVAAIGRGDAAASTRVSVLLAQRDGLQSFRQEISSEVMTSSSQLIKRFVELEGADYLELNKGWLQVVLMYRHITRLTNSNRRDFFVRNGLESQFRPLFEAIPTEDMILFSRIIYENDLSKLGHADFQAISGRRAQNKIDAITRLFDNLLNAIDTKIAAVKTALDTEYERLQQRETMDTRLAQLYYSNTEAKTGSMKIQEELSDESRGQVKRPGNALFNAAFGIPASPLPLPNQ